MRIGAKGLFQWDRLGRAWFGRSRSYPMAQTAAIPDEAQASRRSDCVWYSHAQAGDESVGRPWVLRVLGPVLPRVWLAVVRGLVCQHGW